MLQMKEREGTWDLNSNDLAPHLALEIQVRADLLPAINLVGCWQT